MEAVEFIELVSAAERGEAADAPIQTVQHPYAITVRLNDSEHKMLQRLKEATGQDDSAVLRSGLRLALAVIESGDSE